MYATTYFFQLELSKIWYITSFLSIYSPVWLVVGMQLRLCEVLELCEIFVASSFNESTNELLLQDLSSSRSSRHDSCGWKVSSCVECSDGVALFLELSQDELELPLAEPILLVGGRFFFKVPVCVGSTTLDTDTLLQLVKPSPISWVSHLLSCFIELALSQVLLLSNFKQKVNL